MSWRAQLQREHDQRIADDLWRTRRIIDSPQGRQVRVDGLDLLNFCSNDYLGLANHGALAAASIAAIERLGTGSAASHLICGHFDEHHQLESELAEFVGAESAIVFSTGYMANLAIPQTFLQRQDLILEDRLNHASLIDAGRFGDATMKRYPHLDVDALARKLERSGAARKMVSTDGVFSMDGDQAPIAQILTLCKQHDALLVVDDAHGFGVLGDNGAGLLRQSGLSPTGNLLLVGTLGKSAGSFGAFIAGDEVLIQTLIQHARTYIYTTALPPSVVAASRAALRVIRDQPERRTQLVRNVEHFRRSMSGGVLKLLESQTPIQPVVMGSSTAAMAASELLKENEIWVSAIRPPTVPAGSARLRITLTADHSIADIDRLVDGLRLPAIERLCDEPAS